MSGRETAALLGLGRDTTARVLASGLAGEPVVTSTAKLFERSRVEELRVRPEVTVAHVRRACPEGILVGRLDPRRTGPEGPWRAAWVGQAMIRILAQSLGRFPLVVTVGSFVLSCHDIVGCSATNPPGAGKGGYMQLDLREPGDWSRHFEERLLVTPPGHPLLFWACRAMPPIRRTRRHADWASRSR